MSKKKKSAAHRDMNFKVPVDFHRKVKVRAATLDMTMRDYIVGLVEEDLARESASLLMHGDPGRPWTAKEVEELINDVGAFTKFLEKVVSARPH